MITNQHQRNNSNIVFVFLNVFLMFIHLLSFVFHLSRIKFLFNSHPYPMLVVQNLPAGVGEKFVRFLIKNGALLIWRIDDISDF